MESSSIFSSLDAPFLNFNKDVDPIVWQSGDILVMQQYDLRIPAMAGSVVKYSFSTTLGDISFAAEFHAPGQPAQVIVASMRVPSDVETIKGSFKADCDGSFLFLFDNAYSWFTSKTLSYSIHLHQPAFAVADSNRVRQSQRLLQTTIEDSRRAQMRLLTANDRLGGLCNEIDGLAKRIALLSTELDGKHVVLKSAMEEVEEMETRIQYNREKKNGLCIRCLDNKAMSLVLSYVGSSPSSALVCKYWKVCVEENQRRDGSHIV